MRSLDELEAAWLAAGDPPRGRGVVRLLCVRTSPGVHEVPTSVRITPEGGVTGDRWARGDADPLAQVTLMNATVAELVADGEQPLHAPGDNLLVDLALDEAAAPPGTRLRAGTVLLEVTAEPHTGCGLFRERFGADALRWVNHKRHRARNLRGVNCRVLEAGEVRVGDAIEVVIAAE